MGRSYTTVGKKKSSQERQSPLGSKQRHAKGKRTVQRGAATPPFRRGKGGWFHHLAFRRKRDQGTLEEEKEKNHQKKMTSSKSQEKGQRNLRAPANEKFSARGKPRSEESLLKGRSSTRLKTKNPKSSSPQSEEGVGKEGPGKTPA